MAQIGDCDIIPAGLENSPAIRYVTSKGWNWNGPSGDQIQIETCPFCHKSDYKFYMAVMDPAIGNRDGVWKCFHGSCGKQGNLHTLQEELGDKIKHVSSGRESGKVDALPDVEQCHADLLSDAECMDYLTVVRGFTKEVIQKQKLGLKERVWFRQAGETRALVFPYLVNGNIVYAKYRSLPPAPKDFISPSGWEAPLYNGEIIKAGLKEVVFVEGEADALACLSSGVDYVVGVPGASVKKATWIELLDNLPELKIFILYDNDKAGQKGAQELASRIGIDRCYKITVPKFNIEAEYDLRPGKDINEWFRYGGGTLEKFEELKQQAKLFDVTGVMSARDAAASLKEELEGKVDLAPTYLTQWTELNRLVGFENGDVIDILAPEKIGKTTFGLNLLDHMVSTYGENGLLVCLEMTQQRLSRKHVAMLTGFKDKITTPGTEEAKQQRDMLLEAVDKADHILANRAAELFFCYPPYTTPEDIYKIMRDCVRRYGVKWIMLDNLQLLCDTTKYHNRTEHLSQISKALAKIAKEYNVKMIRILQPHQIKEGEMVQSRNIDGSSQVRKDCDCLITLHRSSTAPVKLSQWEADQGIESAASFEPRTFVNVALSRYSAGGSCKLFFHGEQSKFETWENVSQPMKDFNELLGMKPVAEEEPNV